MRCEVKKDSQPPFEQIEAERCDIVNGALTFYGTRGGVYGVIRAFKNEQWIEVSTVEPN